jgi:6-phosphogluconolactonase (cycloisomerase 2 family)
LYAISPGSGAIAEQGTRTPVGTDPTVLAMDSAGAYLYVANTGQQSISAFSIDATSGNLTAIPQLSGPTTPLGITPINIEVSPSGGFLYVTGGGYPGYIQVFSLTNGVLTAIQGSPFSTGTSPYGLAITPSGGFLYTANNVDNSIAVTSGALSPLSNSPIGQQTGYSGPVALLIDKSGSYLYVANQGTTNIAGYSIGSATGALTLLTTSPFSTGANPSVLASDPNGKYLFVGNQKSPFAIQSFSLNTSSGDLTSVHSYTVPGAPSSIATTY